MFNEYEEYILEEASVQFLNADGTAEAGVPFGCVGTMEIDPELVQVVKKCGIEQKKSVTKTAYLNVSIGAHINRDVAHAVFGLSNDGLKDGVYALDKNAVPKDFIFTGVVWNLDRTVKKYIALPKVSNVSGFIKNIDNAATELAYLELDLNAMFDSLGKAYYEGYDEEITDETVKTQWLTSFKPELVKEETPEG